MRLALARALRRVPLALALALPACSPQEQAPARVAAARPGGDIVPLRSLRLYEVGVGYFERSGRLGDGGAAGPGARSLPVPAGHLDDALESLVVLGGGAGGRVTGVAFTSSVTRATARTRAGLPEGPDAPISFRDLLTSMKGEEVVVTLRGAGASAPVKGRLVEVTEEDDVVRAHALLGHKDAKLDMTPRHVVLSLLTARGEVTELGAEDVATIRPTDPAYAARLDAAVNALSTRNAQTARALSLLGDAKGEVTFGYVAETPLWRASYRLVLGDGAELQGWALVHNDTDEDWRGIHLELVNGEPDSFVYPLAAPRYARRPLVAPEEPLSTLPQLGTTTADALWGEHLDGSGAGSSTGYGYGMGSGRLGGAHVARAPQMRMGSVSVSGNPSESSVLGIGNLAALAPAAGVEQGALFVYAVPAAFSLAAHSSALVPFVSRGVEAETIALFPGVGQKARAALRFVNGTGQTLPAGTLAVFGGGGFTGETSLERLKPGDRRFLEIGNDLDADATEKKVTSRDETRRVTFADDRLAEHFVRTRELTWELENRSGAARTFYVRLPVGSNAQVKGADRVDFDAVGGGAIAVFVVPPKVKVARSFVVTEGLEIETGLATVTEKQLRALLARPTIAASDLSALQRALDAVRALEAEQRRARSAEEVVDAAGAELDRLREDLKALGGDKDGAGAAAGPLVKRVVDAEDRVGAANRARDAAKKALEDRLEAARSALQRLEADAP